MSRPMPRKWPAVLLLLLTLSVVAAGEQGITVLVTNDVHGYVYEDAANARIGYALLKGYADSLEQSGRGVFLLDAGDAFSGNTLAQFDAGTGVARLMGRLGYRVLAPGNHAFDYNASSGDMRYYPDVLLGGVAANNALFATATCLNLESAVRPLPNVTNAPVVLLDDGDIRLVVAGVITPYAASSSSPENTDGFYSFGLISRDGKPDHAATRQHILDAMTRALRPYDRPGDTVIILSHVGDNDTEDYRHGQLRGSDFAALPNVDFVVDAHTHNHVPVRTVGSARYGNAGRYLERFTEISLTRTPAGVDGAMRHVDYATVKAAAAPSEDIVTQLRALADSIGLDEQLFQAGGNLLADDGIDSGSTPLGRFICKSMNEVTGADLSLFNSGSIRSGLADGWVTLGSLYDMIPFQNNLITFTMTGQEILDFFRAMPLRGTNPFPQFHGMRVDAWEQGEGEPLGIAGVRDGSGQPLDPERRYTVATNSFMAAGGDGYAFTLTDKRDHGDQMALFAAYLRRVGTPDLDSIRENGALVIHATQEEADKAHAAIPFRERAVRFRQSAVQVTVQSRSHNGENPTVGRYRTDIRYERPSFVGGYWWDANHVIVPDSGLQDRFIQSLAVTLPGTQTTYPATLAGRFVSFPGVLLEVGPDSAGNRPPAVPLRFRDGDVRAALLYRYGWEDGEWRVTDDGGPGALAALADDGTESAAVSAPGVLLDAAGEAVGLAFGGRLALSGAAAARQGSALGEAELFPAAAARAALVDMLPRLARAVLECRFHLRLKVDNEAANDTAAWLDEGGGYGESLSPEIVAPGWVVGPRRLLVPFTASPAAIGKIESIRIIRRDGAEVPARFAGALRRFQAVVLEVDEDLPVDILPPGFSALDPGAGAPAAAIRAGMAKEELLLRWRIDYSLGRRRELADFDRWLGTFRGFRGDAVVKTLLDEKDGHLAFDTRGNLVAVSLAPRLVANRDASSFDVVEPASVFMPVEYLRRQLAGGDIFDPSLVPVEDAEARRLVDFGVETQGLNEGTSRVFKAERETRAGEIGLLVNHVYPGSIAASLGIRNRDILLRLFLDGRGEPVELSRAGIVEHGYDLDFSSEAFQRLFSYLPAPWPSRADEPLTRLLTRVGAGREAVLEYVRDGRVETASFVTRFGSRDYRSSGREQCLTLGLTVRPVTYEVARYFGRGVDSGVVIAYLEPGGKGDVGGLRQYQLVTKVDGESVAGTEDFRERVAAFAGGDAASVELTVEDFGKTRLVRIE